MATVQINVNLQNAATASANGNVAKSDGSALRWSIYLQSNGTTSGGTIILEEAYDDTYTGTWSQIASVAASSFTGNKQAAFHFEAPMVAVRARISSDITGGGTLSAWAVGC
jgi:hypothetical protein